jgi:hypothetical protein
MKTRGHWEAPSREVAIERAIRFYNASGCIVTAKEFKRRANRVDYGPKTAQDIAASSGDSKACACWALKWAAGTTFEDARAAWELVGARKRNEGTHTARFIEKASDLLGLMAVRIDRAYDIRDTYGYGTTLRAFATAHPIGRYVVIIRQHALALVDGKYMDCKRTSDLSKIQTTFRLVEK